MKKIAYLLTKFPQVTETFVLREVEKVSQQGVDIQPYSLKLVSDGDMKDDLMRKWHQKTIYVPASLSWQCLCFFFAFLCRKPFRLMWCLRMMVRCNITNIRILMEALSLFPQCAFLAARFKNENIGWAHAHFGGNATTVVWILNQMTGLKYSFTPHAFELYQKKNRDGLLGLKIRCADFVVAISEFNRCFLRQVSDDGKDKFPIVHYGVAQVLVQSQSCACAVPFLLVSVGRLVEKKGHAFLIEAMAYLKDKNVRCQIIGDGPLREDLQHLIVAYGLEKKIKLLGEMNYDQIVDKLKRADIFCLSCVVAKDGDQDGIPVALIEAMSYGLPAISTTVSGIPELIQNGVNGLLVPPRDKIALKNAIHTLIQDARLRAKLSRAGMCKVARDFNLNIEAVKLANLFRQRIGT